MGEILSPQNGEQLELQYRASGTLADIPDDRHIWLFVRVDNVLYARKPEISRSDQTWSVTIAEEGRESLRPDQRFALVLLMVDSAGHKQIESSLQEDNSSKALEDIPGRAQLDSVEDLSLHPPPDVLTHPLAAVFPQADRNGDGIEEGSSFEFSDPKSTDDFRSAFTVAPDCSREGRPIGLIIEYDMRPKGSYGGWGVRWTEGSSEPFDASTYSRLILWVKSTGDGANFEIGLKDDFGDERKSQTKTLTVVEQEWQALEVPLTDFSEEDDTGAYVDLTSVVDMNLGFNENHGQGSICIDQIEFE
jgi:Carbohydrate binding domain (family 11)